METWKMGLFNFGGSGSDAQPWLKRKDWASGRVKNSGGLSGLLFFGGFALFWNVVSWTLTVKILTEGIRDPITYVVLLFPAVGLGLLGWLAYICLRWRKYGKVVFEMSEVPGVLGGPLAGVILIPTQVAPREGFRLSLKSIHTYTTGSGKNRRQQRDTVWEATQVLTHEAMADDPTQTALPVYFDVPYDTQPTSSGGSFSFEVKGVGRRTRDTYSWKLEAKAKTEGIDFGASFDVPVYPTEHSNESLTQAVLNDPLRARGNSPTQSFQAVTDPEEALRDASVQITGEPGAGKVYAFRQKKSPVTMAMLLLLGGALPIGLIALALSGGLSLPFALVGVGIGVVAGVIGILYMSTATATVYRDRIELENRSLLGRKQQTLADGQLASIETAEWCKVNGVPVYSLAFMPADGGKPFKLRSGLKGMPLANQAVRSMYAAMDRNEPESVDG
ncbi:MAG: hypothetical protein ACFB20_09820 [Opitutales bacterium]